MSKKKSSATGIFMKPVVINCRKNRLLDISIDDEEIIAPRTKKQKINLNTDRRSFNKTILSTTSVSLDSYANELDKSKREEEEPHQDANEATVLNQSLEANKDAENNLIENNDESGDAENVDFANGDVENGDAERDEAEYISNDEDDTKIENENEIETVNVTGKKAAIYKQKPKFFNAINSRHVLVLLRNKLYFNGHVHVTLIAGSARIFGYQLVPDKKVDVHSPKGYSLLYIEPFLPATNTDGSNQDQFTRRMNILKPDFLAQDIDYLQTNFNGQTDAIVLLERNSSNTAVHMTERYMRETFIPNLNEFNSDNYYYSSEFILHCQLSFRPRCGLIINPDWDTIEINNKSRVFVVGGQGVGKSTCLRYLINSNLSKHSKFLLIDLDIGQPELFLPQTISATLVTDAILGPGFLKNVKPLRSIYYGDLNVLLSPIKYLKSILALHAYCKGNKELANIPWVINTLGYTRGLGYEIISSILRVFNPTDLIQIQSRSYRDNFYPILTDNVVNNYQFDIYRDEMDANAQYSSFNTHVIESVITAEYKRNVTSRDIRYAMILAKLGIALKSNSDWLTSVKPFQ